MNALLFLFITIIKNWFRQLLKKPAALVPVIAIVFFFLLTLRSGNGQISQNQISGVLYFRTILFLLLGFIIYLNLSTGLKQGSTFFSMADVNFLFTSPLPAQAVLLYGIIRQMGTSALATLFLLYQGQNMRNLLGFGTFEIFIVLFAWFLMAFSSQIIALGLYSFTAAHPSRRRVGRIILRGFVLLLILGGIISLLRNGGNVDGLWSYFNWPGLDFFPLIGWINGFIGGMISRDWLRGFFFLALTLILPALSLLVLKRSKGDYYEDVLQATENMQAKKAAVQSGEMGRVTSSRVVRTGKSGLAGKSGGASTFFWRQITEQRRSGALFIDFSSFIVIGVSIVGAIILQRMIVDKVVEVFTVQIIALVFFGYMLFFMSLANKFNQEMAKPYIYLVPASGLKKLFFANLAVIIKTLLEGIVVFSLISVMTGLHWWYSPLAALVYASLALVYTSLGILVRRILGFMNAKLLSTFIYFLTASLIMGPGLAIFGILLWITYGNISALGFIPYLVAFGYNLVASLVIFYVSRGILAEKI